MTRRNSNEGSKFIQLSLPFGEAVHTTDQTTGPSYTSVDSKDEIQESNLGKESLWEQAFSKENLARALARVVKNKGKPGTDGMTTAQFSQWFETNWEQVRTQLDEGTYKPKELLRKQIRKPDGSMRALGIPCCIDRLITQAICQVLVPIFDPTFSNSSFGYRPNRSAHGAVKVAQGYLKEGAEVVVELDLDKFFDRVNHDMLMARIARRIADKALLKLIRAFLTANIMVDGVCQPVNSGTPQGSPLSPLCSNIMLDDLDKELEKRGHRFVRYADDVRIFCTSHRAAQRILASTERFVEKKLKLKVNTTKSKVTTTSTTDLLGFGFKVDKKEGIQIKISASAKRRTRTKIRRLTARYWAISMDKRIGLINKYRRGWIGYFWLTEVKGDLALLDGWTRRRLRAIRWIEWKRAKTRQRMLIRLGGIPKWAMCTGGSSQGVWALSMSRSMHHGLNNQYWADQGLVTLISMWQTRKAY